ncbi:MAG: hypothetical protein IK073_08060 [Paludibacteraceae bacterium]|nr:hypothetical protein [Paludibacteraceae bacterium]
MLVLVSPLNWGLGHATRCIPLIQRLLDEGHQVVLGGDGESLMLLRRHFPKLSVLALSPLNLRYSRGHSQVGAMLRAMPRILWSSLQDHRLLRRYQREYGFEMIISDNRFGLYTPGTRCVYLTHQLHICLPDGWHWLEPLAHALHARIYNRYAEVWVPDYEDTSRCLSGALSHPEKFKIKNLKLKITYIGPLSRFTLPATSDSSTPTKTYDTVAVLSGLEPQRSLFEQQLRERFAHSEQEVLLVQGLIGRPRTTIHRGHLTVVPHLSDNEMRGALLHAHHIIARSGYSTIMDLAALGVLDRAELIPTPGQPEQIYLARAIDEARGRCRDGRNA